jgi:hypothetical protein
MSYQSNLSMLFYLKQLLQLYFFSSTLCLTFALTHYVSLLLKLKPGMFLTLNFVLSTKHLYLCYTNKAMVFCLFEPLQS